MRLYKSIKKFGITQLCKAKVLKMNICIVGYKEKRWRTPAERVRIKLDIGSKYQLLNLIKLAYVED